jgi:hypothetical protein
LAKYESSAGEQIGLKSDTSYDEMMVGGFQRLVNNAGIFEAVSFPSILRTAGHHWNSNTT